MSSFFLRVLSKLLLGASLLLVVPHAPAQSGGTIGPDHLGLAVGAAAAAIGVGIGVGVYFIVRQSRVTGCVASDSDGKLTLQGKNAGDPLYLLDGETGALQAGNQVKVVGKKKNANKQPLLLVSRVAKTYGPCSPAAPAHALKATPFSGSPDVSSLPAELGGMQLADAH